MQSKKEKQKEFDYKEKASSMSLGPVTMISKHDLTLDIDYISK